MLEVVCWVELTARSNPGGILPSIEGETEKVVIDGDLGDGKGETKGEGDGDDDNETEGGGESDGDGDNDGDGEELEGGGTGGVVSRAVVGALFFTKSGMELVKPEGNDMLFSTTGFQMLSIIQAHCRPLINAPVNIHKS